MKKKFRLFLKFKDFQKRRKQILENAREINLIYAKLKLCSVLYNVFAPKKRKEGLNIHKLQNHQF